MEQNFNISTIYSSLQLVDSGPSQVAIDNITKIDTEMLAHMDNLQDRVQKDLTKFHSVIVSQFTPGGGKFTLLRNEYGNESRTTVEPVSNLFALAKSIAHAPLGIYGCFAPYALNPMNQGWREPLESYLSVLQAALDTFDDIQGGLQIDETLKNLLAEELNKLPDLFGGEDTKLTPDTVVSYIQDVLKDLLGLAIDFINDTALPLKAGESIALVFEEWCNESNNQDPHDKIYNLIVQCQVISATTQYYGISTLIEKWKNTFTDKEWSKLYVVVEAEWVTRNLNSIAQCILPHMSNGLKALNQELFIVTNLSDVEGALHFLSRILEDRGAANLILTTHKSDREHLSGQTDLLGPVMAAVVCGNMQSKKEPASSQSSTKCPYSQPSTKSSKP